jgi:hypothetical protein
VFNHQEYVLAQAGSYPRLVPFRVCSLQVRDFSDGLSDHTLGDGSTSLHVWDWAIFRLGHALKYERALELSSQMLGPNAARDFAQPRRGEQDKTFHSFLQLTQPPLQPLRGGDDRKAIIRAADF